MKAILITPSPKTGRKLVQYIVNHIRMIHSAITIITNVVPKEQMVNIIRSSKNVWAD